MKYRKRKRRRERGWIQHFGLWNKGPNIHSIGVPKGKKKEVDGSTEKNILRNNGQIFLNVDENYFITESSSSTNFKHREDKNTP